MGSPALFFEENGKLFGILLYRSFVSSPTFIDLLNHLFSAVWTRGYLFFTLGYNPMLLDDLALRVAPVWVTESSFTAVAPVPLRETPLLCAHVCFTRTSDCLLDGVLFPQSKDTTIGNGESLQYILGKRPRAGA